MPAGTFGKTNGRFSAIAPRLYPIYVGFDQIRDGQTVIGENRDWYLNLPTSFHLKREDIDKLRGAGKEILETSKPFQALKSCLQ